MGTRAVRVKPDLSDQGLTVTAITPQFSSLLVSSDGPGPTLGVRGSDVGGRRGREGATESGGEGEGESEYEIVSQWTKFIDDY